MSNESNIGVEVFYAVGVIRNINEGFKKKIWGKFSLIQRWQIIVPTKESLLDASISQKTKHR